MWFQRKNLPIRRLIIFALIIVFICAWTWTQNQISENIITTCGIKDRVHGWTDSIHTFFFTHPAWANGYLIATTFILEIFDLFLVTKALFGSTVRPGISFLIFVFMRQSIQSLMNLPLPDGIIWRYPGVPSLGFVNYSISNDLFFSAHTGVSILVLFEVADYRKRWLTCLTALVVIFEISATILLRFHYTMDVYAGIVSALVAYYLSTLWSSSIDRILDKASLRLRKALPWK